MENSKYIIKCDYPASWWGSMWREALPSGNGRFGAAVYGGIYEETILLNHEDLWWQGGIADIPDVSDKLPEIRRLLLENKAKEADKLMPDVLKQRGYQPKRGCPLPLGDFKVIMPGNKAFKKYCRSLNMENGEVVVSWWDGSTRYERALFVSRSHDAIIYELKKQGDSLINARLYLDLHDKADVRTAHGRTSKLPEGPEIHIDGDYIYYAAKSDDGTQFGAVAKVSIEKGSIKEVDNALQVEGAESVLITIKLFAKSEKEKEWTGLSQELAKIKGTYSDLLKIHAKEHARLFNAMRLDLRAEKYQLSNEELLRNAYKGDAPKALIEKMWAYGRYLLISASRPEGQPCAMYGLWCGDYQAHFAFHMANENIQMIYWQALSGNIPQMLLAVFNYYEKHLEDYRTNAKKLYGCRGIYIPAPSSPESGLLKTVSPHIIYWTGCAGWLAQHYYDYYLYTGDIEFLRKRALPFMREAAQFYEDFFIIDENGYYMSIPSTSPENNPGNYWDGKGMGGIMRTTINATMDFAIAKELLTNLIEGALAADIYQDEVQKWKSMLEQIPPYEINEDGAVKEWMHRYFTDNYHHRHQSHIYPAFPGIEVTKEDNPELFQAFVTAIKKRLIIGLKEQSGWSLAHMANIYARMGEGDLALECLEILSRSCVNNSLFTYHNDWRNMGIGVDLPWAPLQLDANMGWTAAVQEMLLFSKPGFIRFLPALPQKWGKGSVKAMQCRGGIEVSMEWDVEEKRILIQCLSRVSQEVTVCFPEHTSTYRSNHELIISPLGDNYRIMYLPANQEVCIEAILV